MAAVRFRGARTIGYFGSSHGENAKGMDRVKRLWLIMILRDNLMSGPAPYHDGN